MQQIKIFKTVDTDIAETEKQINRWMRKSGARILSITGNISSQSNSGGGPMNSFSASDILIIVHYEIDRPSA
ncbi:MAG: hypothetical protein P8L85_15750 [Rubripirellula sp.]|nr:hypothetical protein [Rubripirellula sp.]